MADGHQASAYDTDDCAFRVGRYRHRRLIGCGGRVVEWSFDAMLVAVAGTGLTFGLWWMYFTVPAGQMLHVTVSGRFP
jgi:hypothetical protein